MPHPDPAGRAPAAPVLTPSDRLSLKRALFRLDVSCKCPALPPVHLCARQQRSVPPHARGDFPAACLCCAKRCDCRPVYAPCLHTLRPGGAALTALRAAYRAAGLPAPAGWQAPTDGEMAVLLHGLALRYGLRVPPPPHADDRLRGYLNRLWHRLWALAEPQAFAEPVRSPAPATVQLRQHRVELYHARLREGRALWFLGDPWRAAPERLQDVAVAGEHLRNGAENPVEAFDVPVSRRGEPEPAAHLSLEHRWWELRKARAANVAAVKRLKILKARAAA